jgi:hypothetical protein
MTSRSSAASHACHSGLAMLLAVALGLLSGCSARQSAVPTPARAAPTPAPRSAAISSQPAHAAAVHLTAEIGYSHAQTLFHVENRDTFPWSNCQFTLNAQGTTPGYTLVIASMKPGIEGTAVLRAGDFTDAAGRKFDPVVNTVSTLDVGCDTPQGRLRAYPFLLGEPPQPPQRSQPL